MTFLGAANPARSARRHRLSLAAMVPMAAVTLTGCSVFSTPVPTPVRDSSLAPTGSVGYVVCANAVTPVELATRTAEAAIPLPISGSPVFGDFAIATSADGRWAYVVTTDGVAPGATAPTTAGPTGATASSPPGSTTATTATTAPDGTEPGSGGENVVIPIDLVTQQAERPISIPGQVGTHAIVVLPGGNTVLAASGNTIVPIDVSHDEVGTPLDLGSGQTVFGMALDPRATTLYVLVPGGVIPVDTANFTAGAEIPTSLSVSSVYSPHGIVVTDDGATVYVVGQGAPDYGGRVLPIATATGTVGASTSFDYYGISDPAALADEPDGSLLLVVDSANNWINPVPLATFFTPPAPVHLPSAGIAGATTGSGHPTDIVLGTGSTGAFVVEGFDAVLPYEPASETFGRAIPVCSGASSMAVAPAP
ncbi:MAG TPA: hypothetical protein VHW93_05135 [Acidimicrobiales bacterium]|jgi:hypothetical protein|nr:hypothetical protein [Acidimicrobiales bacterium]